MSEGALQAWRDRHAGETLIVCGCGPSLNTLPLPPGAVTIGVNDIGRRFDPDYLVVVNRPQQFVGDRFEFVRGSRAKALFTQLDLGAVAPPVVRFRLGRFGGTEPEGGDALHYTQNSPYVAVQLAAWMGAARIGLVGVDFTEHHFFGATGRHPLAPRLAEIDGQYGRLHAALARRGIELVNLSAESRLASLPKAELTAWLAAATRPRASAPRHLRIVSYATTPVAGVPPVLARCIAHATPHAARCVWAGSRYANGVAFDGDVEWSTDPARAEDELAAADAVIVHNGKVEPRHARLLATKPVVTLAHNYGWNVDMGFVRRGLPGLVVAQYQATLPEFAGWTAVPNPLPLWEPAYRPQPRPQAVTVCYTPSAPHERYPAGHRLFWHAKGHDTTMAVLDRLAAEGLVRLEVLRGRAVPHAEALAMKRRAHIVIDECVTGSYHRNSLEGLAAGALVVNGVGLLPAVAALLPACAPGAAAWPFEFATLATLEPCLRELAARGAPALEAQGLAGRDWLARHWDFGAQWARVWQPAIERAIEVTAARRAAAAPAPLRSTRQETAPMKPPAPADDRVSVIVPHGGRERLPLLAATLASLAQAPAAADVVVVELGAQPVAAALAAHWGARHLFVEHAGPFERARALNAGSALARHEIVVWHDNDLLHAPGFLGRAAAELRTRALDMLLPYSAVHYLSEDDAAAVMRGERAPADAVPVNVLRSGGRAAAWIGCIGLVRRAFVQRHGGLVEGFVGWGGEDDAWFHKAALCGRIAATTAADQLVFHLHHPLSGGVVPGQPGAANPHYAANVERLRDVRAARTAAELAARFPPTPAATGRLAEPPAIARPLRDEPAVWTYWEGPCPAWVRACRRTMARHLPALRLLDPQSFERLRADDADRAIDLSHLHVAHRADFIRAYLLARHGGLWIDADCLVMQPLVEVLALLARHDFVAHRAKGGVLSNAFIGARPGSRIAAAYYARVRHAVATRQRFGWNWLGGDLLTEVVRQDARGFHELPAERVQPICWSRPQDFIAERDAGAHEAQVNREAWTYMLSNVELGKRFPGAAGRDALLRDRSFFLHLLKRSLGGADPRPSLAREGAAAAQAALFRQHGCESVSGTGSSLSQTATLRAQLPLMLQHLGVQHLLDAPCGDTHWMRRVALGDLRYTGVDLLSEGIAACNEANDDARRRHVVLDLLDPSGAPLPRADAVLCRDLLPHLAYAEIAAVLRRFVASGARHLIVTQFGAARPNRDTAGGAWRPLDLQAAPFGFPPPLHVVVERCSEGGGAFADKSLAVWRLEDLARTAFLRGAAAPAPVLADQSAA